MPNLMHNGMKVTIVDRFIYLASCLSDEARTVAEVSTRLSGSRACDGLTDWPTQYFADDEGSCVLL